MLMPVGTWALFLLLAGQSSSPPESVILDGQFRPPRTTSNLAFDCSGYETVVRYEQTQPTAQSLATGVVSQARLLSLVHRGRPLSHDQNRVASRVFAVFARIDSVSAMCFSGGTYLEVSGVTRADWAQHFTLRPDERPPTTFASMRVGRDGAVEIDTVD